MSEETPNPNLKAMPKQVVVKRVSFPEPVINEVMQYLASRPFGEVERVVALLRSTHTIYEEAPRLPVVGNAPAEVSSEVLAEAPKEGKIIPAAIKAAKKAKKVKK